MRVAYLKQKITILEKERGEYEKCSGKERELKEKMIKKAEKMEKMCMEAQAEAFAAQ